MSTGQLKKLKKTKREFNLPKPGSPQKYCKCNLDFIPCSKDWDRCDICGKLIKK